MTMNYKIIFKTVAGSHLYGTNRPDSDMDIRGVCLPPMEALLGLARFEQHEVPGEDTVIYGVRKFCRLALKANPNLVEMLFVPEDAILEIDEYGKRLIENRYLFLSTKVVHTYSGYAFSQLKRIEGHRRWLLNPPIEPTLGQFGGVLVKGQAHFPNQQKQQDYKGALREWKQYNTWRENRNPVRAEMERKYGLDCKHASHLARLLLQARTILTRPEKFSPRLCGLDKKMVLDILHGVWEYEKLVDWARQQEQELKELAETSSLPKKPPFKKVERMVMEMLTKYIGGIA
ncbi:MAG: hypothetical protein E3J82_01480 [Candidatus Thorarchaeota archaeon]|nr:MAG: hypothetical protein E3J82_01480 [Candidatus Thorarchaeota archaeon]